MDINLLEKALTNDNNLSLINTNIQEIKKLKNNILQQLGIKRDELKSFHNKLKDYRYVEDIKDLRYGGIIRCINLRNPDIVKLNNTCILCDIKILNKGIGLVLRKFRNSFFTVFLNEYLIFQKINDEEKILLKAIDHLST